MNKGFTLIEVVIAAALLLLAMGALMLAIITARRGVAAADCHLSATHIARRQMESFFALPFGDTKMPSAKPRTNYYVVDNIDFTCIDQTSTSLFTSYSVTNKLNLASSSNFLKNISIAVIWTNPGTSKASSYHLHSSMSSALHP